MIPSSRSCFRNHSNVDVKGSDTFLSRSRYPEKYKLSIKACLRLGLVMSRNFRAKSSILEAKRSALS